MKVLSIKEPWATLIVEGYKNYEFRSWKTTYRGKILIHASKKVDKDMLARFKNYNISINEGFIIDCILVTKEFKDKLIEIDSTIYERSNHTEKYAWELRNIKKYEEAIPAKGYLGLWNYE